jgi:hypothetical protein
VEREGGHEPESRRDDGGAALRGVRVRRPVRAELASGRRTAKLSRRVLGLGRRRGGERDRGRARAWAALRDWEGEERWVRCRRNLGLVSKH